ncbi:MAG: DUF4271 domain-containing protein [Bacteroidetes bacterium]|nr:DUF4271 domain-containing protein [Bacteroidota bacterium]
MFTDTLQPLNPAGFWYLEPQLLPMQTVAYNPPQTETVGFVPAFDSLQRWEYKGRFVLNKPTQTIAPAVRNANDQSTDWIILGFVIMAGLVVLSKQLNARRFKLLIAAAFGNTQLFQLLREWNPTRNILFGIFTLTYVASASLLTVELMPMLLSSSANEFNSFLLFPKAAIILAAVILFKIIVIKFLGFLFKTGEATLFVLTNMLSQFLTSSLVLIPLAVLLAFFPSENLRQIILYIIILLLLFRYLRSFSVGMLERRYSVLLLFLYLCTLELAPLLLFVKIIYLISSGQAVG